MPGNFVLERCTRRRFGFPVLVVGVIAIWYMGLLHLPAFGWAAEESDKTEAGSSEYVRGELLVKMREGFDSLALEALNQQFGILKVTELFPHVASAQERLDALKKQRADLESANSSWYWWAGQEQEDDRGSHAQRAQYKEILERQVRTLGELVNRLEQRQKRAPHRVAPVDLGNVYLIQAHPSANVPLLVAAYQRHPGVRYAEPNYVMITKAQPLPGSGPHDTAEELWGLKRIQADKAWSLAQGEYVTADGKTRPVVVAVIDTGVDYRHEDLAANVWTNASEIPDNGIDDDLNGFVDDVTGWNFVSLQKSADRDPMDAHGHGTHVAGTIAAAGNNGVGIVGIAPRAKIMAVKGLSDQGVGYAADLARSVYYATQNGAEVINSSWGGTESSQVLQSAFDFAYTQGVVSVAAAGNGNTDARRFYPAAFENMICVAATDEEDQKSSFSNFGGGVFVSAPGDVLSTLPEDSSMARARPDLKVAPGYYRLAGTSVATPHVSGVAALILSRYPDSSNTSVQGRILATADAISQDPARPVGTGRVNAYAALAADSRPFFRMVGAHLRTISQEQWELTVDLKNIWKEAFGVEANLSTEDPRVRLVTPQTVRYGSIPEGETRSSPQPFVIEAGRIDEKETLVLKLTINADGIVQELTFSVPPPLT